MSVVPDWLPNHAYVAGSRVSKTADDNTVWSAHVGGTSGGVEPTWPTTEPWTVVDGTVTWWKASSFREQTTTGLAAALLAFQQANTWASRSVKPARPKSMTNAELPLIYIGDITETVAMPRIRQRTLTVEVGLVDVVADNFETSARMDALVDGVVDCLTLAYHAAGAPSISVVTETHDLPLEEGTVVYEETIVTAQATLAEGIGF